MSVRMSSLVWDRFPGKGSERLLMLALADCANDDGASIYPSVPTLASKAAMTDRRVRQILAVLRDAGWIAIDQQGKGGVKTGTTRYSMNVPKLRQQPLLAHAEKREGRKPASPLKP